MFVIHVEEREILEKWGIYDHGFVDINKNKLYLQKMRFKMS